MGSSISVTIASTEIEAEELENLIQAELQPEDADIVFKFQRSKEQRSGLELIAILSGLAKVLPLVFGFISLLRKRKPEGVITLRASDGTEIEVPADTSRERLKEILDLQPQFQHLSRVTVK